VPLTDGRSGALGRWDDGMDDWRRRIWGRMVGPDAILELQCHAGGRVGRRTGWARGGGTTALKHGGNLLKAYRNPETIGERRGGATGFAGAAWD